MDKDIILVVVGGVIGIAGSVITYIITNIVQKIGKARIFCKVLERQDHRIFKLKIEFINSTNSIMIFRDVCLCLFQNGVIICRAIQGNYIEEKENGIDKGRTMFGDDGNYTIVLEPKSAKTIEGCFIFDSAEWFKKCDSIILQYDNFNGKTLSSYICNKSSIDALTPHDWIKLKRVRK